LEKARKVKKKNAAVSLGYSFVIVWEGVEINGRDSVPTWMKWQSRLERAKAFSFDYVSFKPCLVRFGESQRETLLKDVEKTKERDIIDQIKGRLQEARDLAGDRVKILESSNLKAMLNQEADQIKRQPKGCHIQFFRTVVTPFGIFHCPAFRGVEAARIGEAEGYQSEAKFRETLLRTARSILTLTPRRNAKTWGAFTIGPTGG